ncbi:type IV pilin N-terminal domain-containing protein [Methanospirillum sp.]|jgi:hypothetical protein|uniref:type IV pilin N-terminal domain-containing protein n=1 Tax=Methanospirillum sp. TaxID=45200 RepID=UPI001BD5AE2C|nr:type IV pilin N-terminal domain-containing protein [Methanospirillum sp.]
MRIAKNDKAVSEIIGALLLVTLLITGLSIITVILLSGPPPSTTMKAIIGVKCSWCPNFHQYDLLIGHEGGETINLDNLVFTLFMENNTEIISPQGNITFFSPELPLLFIPPDTCDGKTGVPWPGLGSLSTGQSLKYSVKGSPNNMPKGLLIQEPSSFGLSPITHLKINYIQNITNTSTETGYIGLTHVDNILFSLVPYIGNISVMTPNGCEVEFIYKNTNTSTKEFPFGSTQQSMWNFIEPVEGWHSTWDVVYKRDEFPGNSSGSAVKIKNFTGRIVYNLGSLSTNQVICPD